jgi:hypothetical protein
VGGEIMTVLMEINTWANRCGYFYNANFDPDAPCTPNNGYNCKHEAQEEQTNGVGCCFTWSCPLGVEANEEDCETFGVEYEDSELIIVDIPPEDFNKHIMWKTQGVWGGEDHD